MALNKEEQMLEILQFIFSNFWIWLGTVILIGAISEIPREIVTIIIRKKNDKKQGETDEDED